MNQKHCVTKMLHKNDHKRLRSEQFLRFTIILYITFTKQPPIVISYHVLLILFLLTAFKVQYILVEALTMFVRVHSHILLEFLKISIKDMDSETSYSPLCRSSSPESQPALHSFRLSDCPGSLEPLRNCSRPLSPS